MNRKTLYLAIGDVDDDLIAEASRAGGRRTGRARVIRWGSIAACLLLICAGALFGVRRDVIVYNNASTLADSKVFVPSDAVAVTMDEGELWTHYGLKEFPARLGDMDREEEGFFVIYRVGEQVVQDANTVYYRSEDGTRSLSVTLKTAESQTWAEGLTVSEIDGVPLLLGISEDSSVCWAEMYLGEVRVRIRAYGVKTDAFTAVLREWIRSQT